MNNLMGILSSIIYDEDDEQILQSYHKFKNSIISTLIKNKQEDYLNEHKNLRIRIPKHPKCIDCGHWQSRKELIDNASNIEISINIYNCNAIIYKNKNKQEIKCTGIMELDY